MPLLLVVPAANGGGWGRADYKADISKCAGILSVDLAQYKA